MKLPRISALVVARRAAESSCARLFAQGNLVDYSASTRDLRRLRRAESIQKDRFNVSRQGHF